MRPSDYVVAGLKDGQRMVKRYRRRGGLVILESLNPAYPAMALRREEVQFVYRVV